MAGTATITGQLKINNAGQFYQSLPSSFQASIAGTGGPSPGQVTATTAGTDITLSQVGVGGMCRIQNLDPTNFVTVGIYDPTTTTFYPVDDILPGEFYTRRLSSLLGGVLPAGLTNKTLRVVANTASCKVLVEAFPA